MSPKSHVFCRTHNFFWKEIYFKMLWKPTCLGWAQSCLLAQISLKKDMKSGQAFKTWFSKIFSEWLVEPHRSWKSLRSSNLCSFRKHWWPLSNYVFQNPNISFAEKLLAERVHPGNYDVIEIRCVLKNVNKYSLMHLYILFVKYFFWTTTCLVSFLEIITFFKSCFFMQALMSFV